MVKSATCMRSTIDGWSTITTIVYILSILINVSDEDLGSFTAEHRNLTVLGVIQGSDFNCFYFLAIKVILPSFRVI